MKIIIDSELIENTKIFFKELGEDFRSEKGIVFVNEVIILPLKETLEIRLVRKINCLEDATLKFIVLACDAKRIEIKEPYTREYITIRKDEFRTFFFEMVASMVCQYLDDRVIPQMNLKEGE